MTENNNCSLQTGEVAQTSINKVKNMNFHYKWTISDIRSIRKFMDSPIIFSNDTKTGMAWRMKIQRYKVWGKKRISLQVFLVSNETNVMKSNCKIQLLSTVPENTTIGTVLHTEVEPWEYIRCLEKQVDDILDPANGFLKNGQITIVCDITADVEILSKQFESKCTLHDNLDHVFDNQKSPDITLCASGKEFPAHKAILESHSTVFKAMFEHDMTEKRNSLVEISDIDAEVFEELLRFIYSGRLLNLENLVDDLLYAANKYCIEDLIALCEDELCRNISVEYVTEVLILADLHSLYKLKVIAIKFICTHATEVVKTDGWASMIRSHPDLVTEAFCYSSQRKFK